MTDKPVSDQSARDPVRMVAVSPEAIPAMAELFLSLERILREERPADIDAVTAERRRSIGLLKAVSIFIERSWRDPMNLAARSYLFDLAAMIEQSGDGVVHPMLDAKTRSGPKSDRLDIWIARKFVCAAMECCIRSRKHSRKAAAAFIAGQQPKLKRLMRYANEDTAGHASKDKLSKAILSWHRAFQQGEANKVAQGAWSVVLEILDSHGGGNSPDKWIADAHVFLAIARDKASEIILMPDRRA